MELKEGKKHTGGLRRPFGVAGETLVRCLGICLSSINTVSAPFLVLFQLCEKFRSGLKTKTPHAG